MANEKYFPFRSVSGDRKYSAEDWAEYFALFLSDGVYYSSANKLKVAEYDGMKIKAQKGAGFIGGRMYILDTDKVLTLDTADGVLNRIDRIVLRCDYTNRIMTVTVKKGSYSEKPTAPELTRNADTYELALADVYVAAGTVTITAANITDQRLNTSLCGIVTGLVEQADTTEIFSQFQAYLQEFEQAAQEEFTEWFKYVKDTLSEDAAGNLLKMINEVNESLNNFVNVRIYTGKGFATMAEDIYAEWLKLENGLGSVFLNNGATIFMGSYHRDSIGNMGSMILHENGSDNVYIWSTSGGKYSLNTVALNSDLANLRNIRVSDVLDANSNPFPPNAFLDSALSLGYAHGSLMGLNIGNYIPILTMRWYETSEVVRTVQIAFDGITTHTRRSVSATEWGAWKSGATNSDFATKSIESFITPNADFALGTTHNNAVKSGNVIKLNVFFYSGNNPIANGAIIGSVPSEYIPKYEQRMTVSLGARFGNRFIGMVVFKTDGTIVCDWQDGNLTEVGEIAIYGEYLI